MIWKNALLGALLVGIAVVGPVVTYAGVSVIWPSSTHTVDIDATPPLTWAQGADYTLANTIGFASSFATSDNAASFSITLSGLSGGTVIVDKYANLTKGAGVSSYKMQVATAMSGTLDGSEIASLKIRLWTGATAPTADGSTGVCAVLDLEAAADTETTGSCSATTNVQVVYQLATGSTGSSTVSIRPSSVAFA